MTTVFVAGATGVLGSQIVRNLLDRGASVRALVRKESSDGGRRLADLIGHPQLSLRVGDLQDDVETLTEHVSGADVVLSSVGIGPEVIIDGQLRLLRAAEVAGVPRMIPSDFSTNIDRMGYGVNVLHDLRKRFADAAGQTPVARTSVLFGMFPEIFLGPFHEVVDLRAGTFAIWGDGSELVDLTTIGDAAAFSAAIALDPSTAGRTVQVVGQTMTMLQLRDEVEKATGRSLSLRRRGSHDDLHTEIVRRQVTASSFMEYVALQYQWPVFTGQALLTDIRNNDYPDVTPTTMPEYLAQVNIHDDTWPAYNE